MEANFATLILAEMRNWPTDMEDQAGEPDEQDDCIRIDADEDVDAISKM